MPQIVMCKDCENGHWEDEPCPTCMPRRMEDEIARLRGMLIANDINPDGEYIAKGGLRVNAPASSCEPKF